jgi:hypothetical protein
MAKNKDEASIQEEDVRDQTMREVNVPVHWAYLLGVIGGGTALMIGLIALLGS